MQLELEVSKSQLSDSSPPKLNSRICQNSSNSALKLTCYNVNPCSEWHVCPGLCSAVDWPRYLTHYNYSTACNLQPTPSVNSVPLPCPLYRQQAPGLRLWDRCLPRNKEWVLTRLTRQLSAEALMGSPPPPHGTLQRDLHSLSPT